jgi:tetratricopeptide (TPR) repeat protein
MRPHRSTALAAALLTAASFAAPARAGEPCVPPAVTAALADSAGVASLPAMSFADLLKAGSAAPAAAATALKKVPRATPLAPRPLDAAEAALAGAYQRFVCDDKPAAGDTAALARHLEIAYRRARLYFSANHFQEAAAVFREIAASGAETEVSVYAMQLYLDSINALGAKGAEACFDDMARDVPVFLGLYCKDGRERTNADACVLLDRIQRDVERLAAENEVRAASDLPREQAMDRYRAGAERYLEIWHRHGEAPCAAKEAGCARMDEVLYNAARAYQAARDLPKSIAVRQILIDPKYHLESTELARRALYEIGGIYQALAEYEQAATWYERFAAASPRADRAPDAIEDAVAFRLALGQDEAAAADAESFVKAYGAKLAARGARIGLAIAQHHLERGVWDEARRRFVAAMPLVESAAKQEPLLPIAAHAGLAQALVRLGKEKDATAEYRQVQAAFRGSEPARRSLSQWNDPFGQRSVGAALTAMGEALFFFAEEKRKTAEALRLPAYTGSARREDIAAFTAKKLAPALAARRKAVEDAERAYLEVLDLQPAPPPRWVVAASARVARMRGLLAAELRALSAPASWKRQGEGPGGSRGDDVRAAWRDILIDASEPDQRAAHAAYQRCVELSVKMQRFDDDARRCAAWLERSYPAEHPRLDEIAPRPRHMASGVEERLDPEPDRRSLGAPDRR